VFLFPRKGGKSSWAKRGVPQREAIHKRVEALWETLRRGAHFSAEKCSLIVRIGVRKRALLGAIGIKGLTQGGKRRRKVIKKRGGIQV